MPRNGAGTYSLPAGNPVVTGTTISSTVQNNTTSDIATALTQSLAYDGQTTPIANLPMGGYKHTGVAVASNLTDYARYDQVQNAASITLSAVSGNNTIIAALTPVPSAYAAGQTFRFVAVGTNTTAVTLNISSLGAKSITKNGTTPLAAGDIVSGMVVQVTYDGTRFQIQKASSLPAFSAGSNATQSINSATNTKVVFNVSDFDTNSCFDAVTNYRFTPNVAGYYQINGAVYTGANTGFLALMVFKNGAQYREIARSTATTITLSGSIVVYANGSTDYFELYVYQSGAGAITISNITPLFNGYLVRAD